MKYSTLPLASGKKGIEREMLRCSSNGELAQTRYPPALGSALTHPNITIDYAETLLELVTDPHDNSDTLYQQLLYLHQYCTHNIGEERLWPASMPCILPEDADTITIGEFGRSNMGKIRRLYRVGLAHRYGKPMQMIAGIHFNYSPPESLWSALAIADSKTDTRAFRDSRYMAMLRNLHRYSWLLCYLFGASPAVDSSFHPARTLLSPLHQRTFYWNNATSLRMSKLGYQNKVDFVVRFNRLDEYIHDLATAVMTPAPVFEYLGIKDNAGCYRQISPNILQISNEYYTSARPKQPTNPGELPLNALHDRGIAYIELRVMDINPYDACGISPAQIRFLETFMLWCLLTPIAPFYPPDHNEFNHNRLRIACCGLAENMILYDHNTPRSAQQWADEILTKLLPIAQALAQQYQDDQYVDAIQAEISANQTQQRLPNRIHHAIRTQEFIDWARARQHALFKPLSTPLEPAILASLDAARDASLKKFAQIDKEESITFEDYLAHYFDALIPLCRQSY